MEIEYYLYRYHVIYTWTCCTYNIYIYMYVIISQYKDTIPYTVFAHMKYNTHDYIYIHTYIV